MAINFSNYGVALGGLNEDMSIKRPKQENRAVTAIKESFTGGVQQMKTALQESQAGRNPLETGAKFGAGMIGAAFSPLAVITKPLISDPIEAVSSKIADIPQVQKFAMSKGGEVTSRVAETTANLSTIAGTAAGAAQGQITRANMAKQRLNNPPQTYEVDPQVKLQTAIRDATPDYESLSQVGKGKVLDRVQEGGVFKGRTVKSNALEIEAGTELSKIPGYEPSATKLSKYQAAKAETAVRGKALENALDQEKVIVPKKEVASRVVKAINEVPNKSLLLQSSDPIIKNYIRVLKNALVKEPGTLKGVLRLRKLLDDMYENTRGKQAFGSDKISALDEINTVARDTLLEYITEKAKNTAVKQSMRSQWNLYRALDMLRTAAEKESGSIVGRAMQKYPLTTKAVKTVGQATGIGGAINLLGGQ